MLGKLETTGYDQPLHIYLQNRKEFMVYCIFTKGHLYSYSPQSLEGNSMAYNEGATTVAFVSQLASTSPSMSTDVANKMPSQYTQTPNGT